jgi:hypothetical protein
MLELKVKGQFLGQLYKALSEFGPDLCRDSQGMMAVLKVVLSFSTVPILIDPYLACIFQYSPTPFPRCSEGA